MTDDPQIPADDRLRIESLVRDFRSRIENLYRVAYIQGQIDQATEDREKMRRSA